MKAKPIDVELVRSLLEYAPELGGSCLRWKKVLHGGARVGAMAGCKDGEGYWLIKVNRSIYKAHRLVWAIVKGEDPIVQIDHVCGIEAGNSIGNLRKAPNNEADNAQNTKLRITNTSGYRGVTRRKNEDKWVAQIKKNGVKIWLGTFSTPEEAYDAYLKAKVELHTFNPTVRD